ncbi:MAG: hypothetical protein K6G22_01440 [Lachnospiraceae bacterium]|nr:hypothetical protein [Lachnospiraceae bacterium]
MGIRKQLLSTVLTVSMISALLTGCAGTADIASLAEQVPQETVTEEDKAATEEEQEVAGQNTLAIMAKGYTGLTNLTTENNEDGTYRYEDMTEDGDTIIINMCAPAKPLGDESLEDYATAFVQDEVKPESTVTVISQDDDLTQALTYSVYKVNWEWGSNEDTQWGTGVVVLTDLFNYYYGYSCGADFYEDNEEFYEEELKSIELVDLSELSDTADTEDIRGKLSLGNDENTNEESDEVELLDDEDDIASADPNKEKTPDAEISRGMEITKKDVTAADIAGYWKYDAYDEMYLVLYDKGTYETYDLKTDDLLSEGTFELKGSELAMTEKGAKEAEKLEVLGSMRIMDSDGDTLSPYVPVKQTAADVSDSSNVTRKYGSYDGFYEDQGDGTYKFKSRSKGVFIRFPSWFSAGEGADYVYATDDNTVFVTGRNVTDEYYSYPGSDEQFVKDIGAQYLVEDFANFFGYYENCADTKFSYGDTANTMGVFSANLWNSYCDEYCATKLFVSPFNDGTSEIMLINSFYGYGDSYARSNMMETRVGGYR